MDALLLSRIQFAMTISFHYIFPPLSIGLGLIILIMETLYLTKRDEMYKTMAKFWVKVFALIFAIGVASGIVMEFQFGTNWATYSRYVGDVFGSPLAAEGIFSFFLESSFLGILLFGWDKVGRVMHWFAGLMVCLGAHLSAVWIVAAGSWMQTPAGYKIVGEGMNARAEITDFWAMVFNPSFVDRLYHVFMGAWLEGSFLVISICAFYLLRKRHVEFAKKSMTIAVAVGLMASVLQIHSGHRSAKIVAEHQPIKLAAMEGHFDDNTPATLWMFGLVNEEEERVHPGLGLPGMLSFLVSNDTKTPIQGLKSVPKSERPPVNVVFQLYHIMIAIGMILPVLSLLTAFFLKKGTIMDQKWLLRILMFSIFLPQIANQVGWFTAEIGRQPWIVYNLLKTSDALSKTVSANMVLTSLIVFTIVYLLLFVLFVFLMLEKIKHGPQDARG